MVKHIILWTLKDEFSTDEKDKIKLGIKEGLESLTGRIPGLESSTVDLMLDSTFEDEAALKAYSVNPAHVEVADTKVRPFTASRACLDYEI